MTTTIYHNPACGTSRTVLAALHAAGVEPVVVEYLKTPPNRETLQSLITALGGSARDLVRDKGDLYQELNLANPEWREADLIDFMLQHPSLINRPIVVTPLGTRLCRPADTVQQILPRA